MRYRYFLLILLQISLLTIAMLGILVSVFPRSSKVCKTDRQDFCLQDNDCIFSANQCFLGNREYYEKCFDEIILPKNETELDACLAAAYGFVVPGSGVIFKPICETSKCNLASFNTTTGERIG